MVLNLYFVKKIQKLPNKFSQDHYCVNNFILLEILLVPVLAVPFNDCIRNSVFQECLQKAIVTPLHKLENFVDPNILRPVSILPTVSKTIA